MQKASQRMASLEKEPFSFIQLPNRSLCADHGTDRATLALYGRTKRLKE